MLHIIGVYKQRHHMQKASIPLMILLLIAVSLFALCTGAFNIAASDILKTITLGFSNTEQTIQTTVLLKIRLPRIVLSIFIGAGLGVCGAAMQALFRNPLADPGLIGVSAGGALGAILVIVLGNSVFNNFTEVVGIYALPIGAMVGCLGVCAVIYKLSHRQGHMTIITLLLAGIAINAIVGSIIGVLTLVSDDSQLRELTFWTMGNLGGNHWQLAWPVLFCISVSMFYLVRLAKPLNLYLLGEAQAQHLGVPVAKLKKQVFFFTALCTGAAVSISGMIGFVGFIVPHLVRLIIGPDHRYLFPASMLLGASLLTAADIIARVLISPAELPIGLVTSALGGPFFLIVLLKQRAI